MNFTEEQRFFAESIKDFCARECGTREQREALTEGGVEYHNQEMWERMAELGWAGVGIPEEYGGSDGGTVEMAIFFDEAWHGMAPVQSSGSSATCISCIKGFGNEEQKHQHLGAMARGEIYAISISEPEAGSDVGAISTRAEQVDGGFILNGQKTWCSAAHHSEAIVLIARTSREEVSQNGLTMFVIPTSAEGMEIRGIDTMGGKEVNDIFLTDVFVPEGQVIGTPGKAWKQVMAGLNGERLNAAAQCVGMAERTLDDLLQYVQERKQFGKAIGTFQALRHRIADLAIEVECAKLLTYDTAFRVVANDRPPAELTRLTSMAKIKATETAKHVALEGMQMMGGYGYACEYDMERHVRIALSPPIYAGTNEIQREIISATYGLR